MVAAPARRRALTALVVSLALVGPTACTAGTRGSAPTATPRPSPSAAAPSASPVPGPASARVTIPRAPATVLAAASPESAAIEASQAVFASAPVVVLAAAADLAGRLTGASAAVALGVPELLTSDAAAAAVATELARLAPGAVLAVGGASRAVVPAGAAVVPLSAGADAAALAAATGRRFGGQVTTDEAGAPAAVAALDRALPAVLTTTTPPADPRPADPQAASPADPGAQPSADPAAGSPAGPTGSAASAPPALPLPLPLTPGAPPVAAPASGPDAVLPRVVPPQPVASTTALVGVGGESVAALATLRAAGLPVLDAPTGDPRATTAAVQAVAAAHPEHVVALGAAFGDPDRLAQRVRTAATGVLAPGGGQLVFPTVPGQPGKRYVALYGTPGSPSLGVLGEQDVPATVARAQQTAAQYQPLTSDTVVPAVEIIATIASAGPGPDGDYSQERSVDDLRPQVEAAGAAGLAVVLDLQPGRADFLAQAQRYQSLLELPYVGLALDPEWRLGPSQLPLRQIGSVDVGEVNSVIAWLADLTATRALPQKLFVVHEFALRMLTNREQLDVSRDQLAVVIHVDGQGTQPGKAGTWQTIRAGAPPVHWGWKNFVDEDHPMLTPEQTYQVVPTPDLVTYQ